MSGSFINQTIDDPDNSTLTYDGPWFRIGTYNASSTGESGTLASTNVVNASVTIRFPTPARAFYVYGMKRSKGGSYGICIDCDPNQPSFIPVDGVDPTDDGTKPPVVLFSRTFDKPGSHVVILRNEVDNRFPNGNSQLAFDRFDLEVANPNGAASSAQSTSTRSPAQGSPSPPRSNTGAIVGGVVGGLLGLLLIAVLIFFLWRRQRQQQTPSAAPNGHPESAGNMTYRDDLSRITPYSNTNYAGYGNPSMYQPSSETTYETSPVRRKQPSDPISPSSRGWGTTTRSEGTSSMFNGSSSGSHVRAIDAGPLTATLPPEYGHWTS